MRIFVVVICLFLASAVKGQYFPVYSQYMLNGLAINPAYSGSRDVLSASFFSRKQWLGFEGSPLTSTFSAHTPLKNRKIGLGLHVIREEIGVKTNYSFFGNYAYRVRLGNGRLSFGLKAGVELYNDNFSRVSPKDQGDLVFKGNKSIMQPNFGLGGYYFTDRFFVGFSVPSILSYQRTPGSDKFVIHNDTRNYNYLFTTGYLLWISNTFKLKPSTLVRYVANSPIQCDFNLNAILLKDGLLWLGASYRHKDAWVAMAEVQMGSKWRLGLSYDYSIGPISKYTSGSIEVMLRMELITVVKTINPRFF